MRRKSEFDDFQQQSNSNYSNARIDEPNANAISLVLPNRAGNDEPGANHRSRAVPGCRTGAAARAGNNFGRIGMCLKPDEWRDGYFACAPHCIHDNGEHRSHEGVR